MGAGGRLRISNGTTDYTLLGTIDTDGSTNTSIVISGNTRSANAGNIQYLATATSGSHIFYTSPTTTTRMTISNAGVNINNDLGVTGNVGIGVAPATYKLNVAGDVNCTGAFRVNNIAIANSWSAGTPTTNIYYNLGNVGIGATTTSDVDDNTAFAIPTATLYVKGGATAGGTCNVVIRGGVAGQNNGKARLWLSADASHSSYIESGHTGSGNTYLTFGTSIGNVLPVERMSISTDGCLYINNNNFDNNTAKLVVVGSDSNGVCAMFYHPNRTQGIGIVYDGLRALGANANQNIVMRPRGTGTFQVEGTGMSVSGYVVAGQYILSSDAVYARNGYDTKIRSDSGGMYLEMGDIGNNNYLRIGAYNGVTNFDSGASRNFWFRTGGKSWLFSASGGSYNGADSIYWTNPCDQRIKENIKKANLQTCYENVKNINLYRFNYIEGYKKTTQHDKTQLGFVAQQVKQHFPKSIIREKVTFEDKREIPDLSVINADQVNYTLFGAVKQLMKVVEKQSKRIKKLEELLNIIDDDEVDNDADELYERIVCDEVDIDTIEPSEPTPDTPKPPPVDIPKPPPADIPMPMGL